MRKGLQALEMFVIWCALVFSGACLIYLLHGESISLLKIDALHMFKDNRPVFFGTIFPLAILTALLLIMCFIKKKAYSFTIHLSVKERKKSIQICYLQLVNQYLHYVVLLCLLIAAVVGAHEIKKDKNLEEKNTALPTSSITHAMGAINGMAYTNSLEAFLLHYGNGQHFFETDFSLTSDGWLVARHDWEGGWQEGIDEENIPTEEVFLKTALFGKYTPLSLKDIICLMQQHEDVYIITDTKDLDPELARKEINILVETAEEMDAIEVVDRFIIQIYSIEMYQAIKDIYEFPNYIFTLYAIWRGDEREFTDYCRFCRSNGIRTITMWDYRCADNPELIKIADRYGISIYVHTVNDQETADEMFSLGIRGIYTDDAAAIKNLPIYE